MPLMLISKRLKIRMWGSNSAKVPFYEEVPLHPDYLLRDFILIFHPDLLPGDTLRYFNLLK